MEREYQWRAKVYGGLEVQKCKDTKEIKKVIVGSVDQWEMNRAVEAERCLMSIYSIYNECQGNELRPPSRENESLNSYGSTTILEYLKRKYYIK